MQPQVIKIAKIKHGNFGQHCDYYPVGSIHSVYHDGQKWRSVHTNNDLMQGIELEFLDKLPMHKHCDDCEISYEMDAPFLADKNKNIDGGHDERICIRCYERRHLPNREQYRAAIREEIKKEFSIK